MPVLARIIVIRRNGLDGSQFPITGDTCVFGRDTSCDIRIQLPFVSKEQCKLSLGKSGFSLQNMTEVNVTNVNNKPVKDSYTLQNKDIITIVDRSFRFEYPDSSPFLTDAPTPEATSGHTTPLREIPTPGNESAQSSPFGMLVKDMKKILKNTPKKDKKSKNVEKVKAERTETPKMAPTRESIPQAKRNSKSLTPKRTPKGKKSGKDSPSFSAGHKDQSTCQPVPSSSHGDVSSAPVLDSGPESLVRTTKKVAEEVGTQKTTLTRRRSRASLQATELPSDVVSSSDATRKSIDADDDLAPALRVKVSEAAEVEIAEKELPNNGNIEEKAEKSNSTEGEAAISIDNQTSIEVNDISTSVSNNDTQTSTDATQKIDTEPVRRRSSRNSRRSSLAKDTLNAIESSPADKSNTFSSNGSSLDSFDTMNVAMISESATEESIEANSAVMSKSPSRRSSLLKNDSADLSMKLVTPQKNSGDDDTIMTDVPNISLTPSKEINATTAAGDPYSFPETTGSDSAKTKKYRRRSAGSNVLSKKQTLMLFGSPRVQNVTPLRRSMGRLKRKSEPLLEDDEGVAVTPVEEKVYERRWTPLPEVNEVENNSSPIKKARRSITISSSPEHDDSSTSPVIAKISRRVSFGPQLSPEQFLKMLPPNTPVRKGATPSVMTRNRSLVATGATNLPALAEQESQSVPSLDCTPKTKSYQKVTRTPTPFKPDPSKTKQTSLLQQVLHTTMHKRSQITLDGSPTLPLGKRSKTKLSKEEQLESCDTTNDLKQESPRKKELIPRKRRSSGNVQLVNVHKTAVNLYRRRSSRCMSKPLWSDIVKKPANVASKVTKKTVAHNEKKKRAARTKTPVLDGRDHHIDSPDTIYIGRTRRRVQNTRTPRPPKSAAPVKLDIPLNESYTGLSEIFATPAPSTPAHDQDDLYYDAKTPKSVGEMLVSPLSDPDTSSDENDMSMTTPVKNLAFNAENGASPDLCKNAKSLVECVETNDECAAVEKNFPEKSQLPDEIGESPVAENMRISSDEKESTVEAEMKHFGIGRLMKSSRHVMKSTPVRENFGTKRLMKTPKDSKKSSPITDNFGTKRLMKTPRESKKSSPVIENFGTKRLMKTPRESKKSSPVGENFGTKRLMNTPRESKKSSPVIENFGTKRLMKTPRESKKSSPVTEHFGTKRIMKTPRDPKKSDAVEEHYGTKRLLRSPRNKNKSAPVVDKFGLKRMFHIPKQKVVPEDGNDDDFCLNNIMASPPSTIREPPLKKQKIEEDVAPEVQSTVSQAADTLENVVKDTVPKPRKTRGRKTPTKSTKASQVPILNAETEERMPTEASAVEEPLSEVSSSNLDKDGKVIATANKTSIKKNAESEKTLQTEDQTKPARPRSSRRSKKVCIEPEVASETAASSDSLSKSDIQNEELHPNVGRSTRARKNVTFHPSVKPDSDQLKKVEEAKQISTKSQPKRGRPKTKEADPIKVAEKEVEVAPASVPPATKKGRGRPKRGELKQDVEEVKGSSESETSEISTTKAAARKGRAKAAQQKKDIEGQSSSTQIDSATEPKAKGRPKKVNKIQEAEALMEDTSSSSCKVEEVSLTETKRGRSRKAMKENSQLPTETSKDIEKSDIALADAASEEPAKQVVKRRQTRSKVALKEQVEAVEAKTSSSSEVEAQENVAPVKARSRRGGSKSVEKNNEQSAAVATKGADESAIAKEVEPSVKPATKRGKTRANGTQNNKEEKVVSSSTEDEVTVPVKAKTKRGATKSKQEKDVQATARKTEEVANASEPEVVARPTTRRGSKKQNPVGDEGQESGGSEGPMKSSGEMKASVKATARKGRSKKAQQKEESLSIEDDESSKARTQDKVNSAPIQRNTRRGATKKAAGDDIKGKAIAENSTTQAKQSGRKATKTTAVEPVEARRSSRRK